MKVYQYNKVAFDKAVEFISNNNRFFLGQDAEIRYSLKTSIEDFIKRNDQWTSTMGFLLLKTYVWDNDDGTEVWEVDILVDPSLSVASEDRFADGNTITLNEDGKDVSPASAEPDAEFLDEDFVILLDNSVDKHSLN